MPVRKKSAEGAKSANSHDPVLSSRAPVTATPAQQPHPIKIMDLILCTDLIVQVHLLATNPVFNLRELIPK